MVAGRKNHFTVRFGRGKEMPEKLPAIPSDMRDLPVLVVDDHAINRRILEEMLANWGMQPTVVEDGETALVEMRRSVGIGRPYPLAIVDGRMPGMDGFELIRWIKGDPGLEGTMVMMLSSAIQSGDAARCRELGAATHLLKPIQQSDLLNTILTVLGEQAPEQEETPASPSTETEHPSHILLVEDNAVNQRLVVRMLERRGHTVQVAGDGRQALALLEESGFDLVLMDVQMPEMDGFEATAAIRDRERTNGEHLPIVAMTAHAMKGDRERCLEAGMDDYLSKPIQREALSAMIGKWSLGVEEDEEVETVDVEREDGDAPFDVEGALERVEGDREFLGELLTELVEYASEAIGTLREGVEADDAERVERSAHSIKGAAANLAAEGTRALALGIEEAGREGRLKDAGELLGRLDVEVKRLGDYATIWTSGNESDETDG